MLLIFIIYMIAGTDKKPKILKKDSAEKPLFISKHTNIIPKIKVRKVITKYFSVLILSKLYNLLPLRIGI